MLGQISIDWEFCPLTGYFTLPVDNYMSWDKTIYPLKGQIPQPLKKRANILQVNKTGVLFIRECL